MANLNIFYPTWSLRLLSILGIVIAFLFLSHGSAKLFGIPVVQHPGLVPLFSMLGLAGVLEFFGGLFIPFGAVYTPGSLYSVGRNGRSLLYGPCTEGVLASSEWRGVGRTVLLCIPLFGCSRRRLVERRSSMAEGPEFKKSQCQLDV